MPPIHGYIPILTFTKTASADIASNRLVGFDDATAGENDEVMGVSDTDVKAGGDFACHMIGMFAMPAGGAIAKGAKVSSNADGLPVAGGTAPFGTALTAAAAAGATVKILVR